MDLPFPASLDDGLIIGHVDALHARIWVRHVTPVGEGPLELAIGGRTLRFRTTPEADHTAVVDVDGLSPDVRYEVAVRGTDLRGTFRTLPVDPERLCFAFTSCHLPFTIADDGSVAYASSVDMIDALRDAIAMRDARFVIHLGDQIYADAAHYPAIDGWRIAREAHARGEDVDALGLFRALYRGFFGVPALRGLHQSIPSYMVWDDGEIRDVHGSVPVDEADRAVHDAMVDAARRAYVEYQHAHNPRTEQLHYAFDAGPASFFVLDLRGQRDFEKKVLLGERQWSDFEAWLARTHGRMRFVVSSVPLHHTPDTLVERMTQRGSALASAIPPAFHDRWSADAFHAELERMMALLLAAPNVIVLSGDIHIGAAIDVHARSDGGEQQLLPQWVSSAITNEAGLAQRLKCELVSRVTNVAPRWPVHAHFHELRNNFGIVELVRRDGKWEATFELWARGAGGDERAAGPAHRVTVRESGG